MISSAFSDQLRCLAFATILSRRRLLAGGQHLKRTGGRSRQVDGA